MAGMLHSGSIPADHKFTTKVKGLLKVMYINATASKSGLFVVEVFLELQS